MARGVRRSRLGLDALPGSSWGARGRKSRGPGMPKGSAGLQAAAELALFRLQNRMVFRGAPGHGAGPEAHLPSP